MTNRIAAAIAVAIFAASGWLHAGDDPQDKPLDKLLGTPISTAADPDRVLSSTAAKYDQTLGSVPASMTIITAEEIERYGWTTLDQVLRSVPGFYLTNDRNYTYLGVRGFGRPTDYNTRILVMLDGHELNEPVIGAAPAGSDLAVDLKSVEKIEIVRGPGSALYGSHAMHAVINIITKNADAMDGVSASARAGSHGEEAASLRFGTTQAGGLQLTGSALWQETNGANLFFPEYDSPETDHGVARGLDYENLYGFTFGLRKGNFNLTASRRSRTKGIPTASYETLFNVDSWTTNWGDLVAADYHRAISADKTIEARASWDRSGEHGIWPYDPSTGVDDTFAIRWGGEARLHWDIRSNQRLTLGAEYTAVPLARYKYDVGDFAKHLSRPYDMTSYFAQYEIRPTPRLGLTLGLRRDDFSATADSTNPRAAILFTPAASTTLKLLYGTAFRSPNIYETFYADPVTPWKANPNLQPERIHTTELEWEQRLSPDLFFVGSLYRIGLTGLIEQVQDPADGIYSYGNEGQSTSRGMDLKIDWRRHNGVWAYLSYSFAHAEDVGAPMDNSPRHLVKGGLSTSPWTAMHFGLDGVYESSRLTRDGEKTHPFLLLNGAASRQLGEHFRLQLDLRNLLNTNYATPVGPELRPQAIRQDGRTLALELTYSR